MGDLAKQREDTGKRKKKKTTVSLTLVSFAVTRQAYQRVSCPFFALHFQGSACTHEADSS